MPSCVVVGCSSRTSSKSPKHPKEKRHFFTIPVGKLDEWKRAIRRENDSAIQCGQYVCDRHFSHDDISWGGEQRDRAGNIINQWTNKVPRLKKGVVPTIFPWDPPPETSENPPISQCFETPPISPELPEEPHFHWTPISPSTHEETRLPSNPPEPSSISTSNDIPSTSRQENEGQESHTSDEGSIPVSPISFPELCRADIIIPPGWMKREDSCNNINFLHLFTTKSFIINGIIRSVTSIELIVKNDMSVTVNILGRTRVEKKLPFTIPSIETIADFQQLVYDVCALKLCQGSQVQNELEQVECSVAQKDIVDIWRHKLCPLWVHEDSKGSVCNFCSRLKRSVRMRVRRSLNAGVAKRIRIIVSPKKKPLLNQLQSRIRNAKKETQRAKAAAAKEISQCQQKLKSYKQSTLDEYEHNGNLSNNQKLALKHILMAAKKKNPKGMRYDEPWILLCMIMHMQSPSSYRFIWRHQILPVPTTRTIRRYLSGIKVSCGFDPKFFETLKIVLSKRDEQDRHGVLLLDEIITRESVGVDTKNLTYTGLVDFGVAGTSPKFNEKANHGLVIMFQPLNGTYTQPIAAFASRGSVQGVVLAQLIVKAIFCMEGAGAKIHGVVTDGASTNRAFWGVFHVTGVKDKKTFQNSREHPVDKSRRLYMFSDTPHLIKTIRNRLFDRGSLQMDPNKLEIKWEHFNVLHSADKEIAGPSQLLICPKLTISHLELTNSAKMRVSLATQIFSESVAKGLDFFRNRVPELRDSEETAVFCRWINELFDALNRTDPMQGLEPGNPDYKVIEEAIQKLDAWEEQVEKGLIPKEKFLTRQTAEGLRVTLHSTLQLVDYLTSSCDFSFVLSGRVNQDPLERFFGSVRQAGGSNEHPSTHNFLQIYKILSIFSVVKPPRTGNCSLTNNSPPESLITLADLKLIHKNPGNSQKILSIKKKLEEAVQHDAWELEHVFDHDYSEPEVAECVMFYMTVNLTNRVMNTTSCNVCKNALVNADHAYVLPQARLTDSLQHGPLIHPNSNLYRFILFLEEKFLHHCTSAHVFDDIVEDVYNYPHLSFPCTEHGSHVIFQFVQFFVATRMQQFCTRMNAEERKISRDKRKAAKLAPT